MSTILNGTIIGGYQTGLENVLLKGNFLWLVAAGLAVLAACFGALGDNLIKLSFALEQATVENPGTKTSPDCRQLWLLGMTCIVVINTSLTLVSYSLADAVSFIGGFMFWSNLNNFFDLRRPS